MSTTQQNALADDPKVEVIDGIEVIDETAKEETMAPKKAKKSQRKIAAPAAVLALRQTVESRRPRLSIARARAMARTTSVRNAAALPPEWTILPLIKVGRDLATEAATFLRTLTRVAAGSRFAEVMADNNRVVLRYDTAERRCERMAGGVPPWTWDELGPMVRDLDAVYINFISGFELDVAHGNSRRGSTHGVPAVVARHDDLEVKGFTALHRELASGNQHLVAIRHVMVAPEAFYRLGESEQSMGDHE